MTIRPAHRDDFPAVLALWDGARSAQASTPDSRETLERLLVQDPGALLVAEDEEGLGGTLIAAWDGWRGNMYRLAVRPELRRRGWGLALVRAGERRLHDLGARRITALVGRGDEPAEALWRAAGYDLDAEIGRFVCNLRTPPTP